MYSVSTPLHYIFNAGTVLIFHVVRIVLVLPVPVTWQAGWAESQLATLGATRMDIISSHGSLVIIRVVSIGLLHEMVSLTIIVAVSIGLTKLLFNMVS